ncbi:hypothetical protein GIB67_018244 [Kingdonia uniflora]|uniref:Uncharacterized protein n=1 Tax=Kingdonia uniflora TaxID=39325 RepID=A0A7J7PAG9_9MAGN|nr:hypothetical protein GIB67_018244 [Kingdonia uniflora]
MVQINIIVATQILEEGLDVQSCNLVIRFDPPATVCSFIQSRGRARMPGSDYILMVQSEDTTTRSKLENYLESGDIMREESLRYASLPCAPLEREIKLHEVGALTDHLLPDLVVDEGDAQDFEDISYEDEQVNYFSRELVSQGQPQMLYHCYHISLKRNFDYDVSLSDFTLLTECSFRGDFEFPLEFELHSNRGSVTVSLVYTGPTHLTPEQVLTAIKFQITVLRLLIDPDLNKLKDAIKGLLEPNDNSLPRVNYLLLPSVGCNKRRPSHSDWDIRSHSLFPSASSLSHGKYCSTKRNLQAKNGLVCSCMLKSSLVFTPHNGYIYCITGILYELDGKSLIKSKGEDIPTTYKKYYHSRYGIKLHYEGQPLLNARHIFTVRNWLQRSHNSNIKEPSNAYVELPPELCEIIMSPIAISTMYTFSLVPSIMHRIESALLASNLKKMQQNHCIHNFNIPTIKILEAITTKKCQEEFSLESLETLGDSFLKYATCKHLFMHNKNFHEGLLSAKKDRIISNHSLCNLGCDRKLQGFIRNECFDPKKWVIPGDPSGCDLLTEILLPFSSEKIYTVGLKRIKRKVIADAVEALVGAYLSTGGESAALLFIDWLGMKVDFRTEAAIQKSQFLVQPQMHVNIRQLELLIGYSFRDPLLLLEALTHGSYQLPDIPGCYQRLEFLGDSVLDYLLTVYLYDKYPGISPGLLTDLRSASVNNDCYALATVKAGLHKYILHASSKLQNQICLLVKKFEQTSMESIFGWESDISLPKVLGDVIESLAGAIFVDSEYNKDIVWKCIRPLLEPLVTLDTVRLHPVRELTELCRQNSFKLTTDVSYVLNGVAALTVEVEANGISHCHTSTGENKKTAKRLASKVVLESLKESIL